MQDPSRAKRLKADVNRLRGVAEFDRTPPSAITKCGFLKLPGEVRDEIYELLLEGVPDHIQVPLGLQRLEHPESPISGEDLNNVVKMGQTCRTVRKELMGMFYGTRTFESESPGSLGFSFLRTLCPDSLAMLRDVRAMRPVEGEEFKDVYRNLWYVHDRYALGYLLMDNVKVSLMVVDKEGTKSPIWTSLIQFENFEDPRENGTRVIRRREILSTEANRDADSDSNDRRMVGNSAA